MLILKKLRQPIDNGVLTVKVPKINPEPKTGKEITVK